MFSIYIMKTIFKKNSTGLYKVFGLKSSTGSTSFGNKSKSPSTIQRMTQNNENVVKKSALEK